MPFLLSTEDKMSDGRMIINDELWRMLKQAVMEYFKVLLVETLV
jgi:hypothetical protein